MESKTRDGILESRDWTRKNVAKSQYAAKKNEILSDDNILI